MLTGAGSLHVVTKDLSDTLIGQEIFMPTCIASFMLTPEEQSVDAKCLEDGKLQISASAIVSQFWKLTMEFQYQDWSSIQLVFDEFAQKVSGATLPIIKTAVINSAGEVVDPDITTITGPGIMVYLKDKPPVFMRKVTSAPTTGDQVQVNTTTGKLIFTTGQAGKTIQYRIGKTYTEVSSIGHEAEYNKFGTLSMSGVIGGSSFQRGMQIIIPELVRAKSPEFKVNGELVSLNLEYRLVTPFGERAPFKLYNLDTAVM